MAFQQWTHLVGVVDDGALTVAVYVNGALGGSEAITQTILHGTPTLYVGKWQGTGRLLVGDVDDIVIYSRALSTDEIVELGEESPPDPESTMGLRPALPHTPGDDRANLERVQ